MNANNHYIVVCALVSSSATPTAFNNSKVLVSGPILGMTDRVDCVSKKQETKLPTASNMRENIEPFDFTADLC